MKELILEKGKARVLKNAHVNIKIGRNTKGYFIISNLETFGPFDRLFIDKSKKHELDIVGYVGFRKTYFKINDKGIHLSNKEKNKYIDIDDYTLLGTIKNHNIYLDNNKDAFFAVNINEEITSLDEYERFDSYLSLQKFYKHNKGINLYDSEITNLINNLKKIFINFDNLYSIIPTLNIDTLPEDSLFDAVMGFKSEKNVFDCQKDRFFTSTYSSKKASELIKSGYEISPSYIFEQVCRHFPLEMDKYSFLVEEKLSELAKDCLIHLQTNSNLDPEFLKECMSTISLDDLPKKISDEIKAKSNLTRKIFLSMMKFCFQEEEKKIYIKEGYKNIKTFEVLFPELYYELHEIAKNHLEELYKEYINRKQI